ncbi:MAG: histidine triad nucleotide-binding protein [Proteobacteria bacterium]|nr:histidine triad nucleotide-binding protein [Pseudomonadota bacterium]MBU1687173.1 histidine triad nucleotide-binding protein [Pseudomonadota bacterium]
MNDCLFCKIAKGEIPANKLYEDDDLLAFWDISPQAPKHFLIIPKKHIKDPASVGADDAALIGTLIRKAGELAAENGIGNGFRLVFNNGAEAGQTVFHIHLHVLGGRPMAWPPG